MSFTAPTWTETATDWQADSLFGGQAKSVLPQLIGVMMRVPEIQRQLVDIAGNGIGPQAFVADGTRLGDREEHPTDCNSPLHRRGDITNGRPHDCMQGYLSQSGRCRHMGAFRYQQAQYQAGWTRARCPQTPSRASTSCLRCFITVCHRGWSADAYELRASQHRWSLRHSTRRICSWTQEHEDCTPVLENFDGYGLGQEGPRQGENGRCGLPARCGHASRANQPEQHLAVTAQ